MLKHEIDKSIADILLKKLNSLIDPFEAFLSSAFESLDISSKTLIINELILYISDFYEFSEKEVMDLRSIKNRTQSLRKTEKNLITILEKLEDLLKNKSIFESLVTHLKI